MTLKEAIINHNFIWKDYNFNTQLKTIITENLIKKGYVTVNYKKITDPDYNVSHYKFYDQQTYFSLNIFIRKDQISNEYSLLNVFNSKPNFIRTIYEDENTQFSIPKKTNTKSKVKFTLDHLIYKSGFCNSLKQAKQFIKEGHILVNNKIVRNSKYIPKKGSVLMNNHPKSLFNYYKQKYYATTLTNGVDYINNNLKYVTYKRYYFALQPNYLTKLDFNKVLFLNFKCRNW